MSINAKIEKYKSLPVQVRASFWFLICSFLQKGISVITTPIFTRLLTTEQYGNYNVFNSWLGIVTIFVTLRLYHGVYAQGLVKFEDDQQRYSSSMQGLNLALCIGWTAVYGLFHNFWNRVFTLTTVQMSAMMLMIWATGAFTFWAQEQRYSFSYRKLVLVTLLVSFFKPVLGVIFVIHSEDKVTARILGIVLVELIGYSGLSVAQMIKGKKLFDQKYWKYALMFNIPLIPHYLSMTVLNSSDRIMIKAMTGAAEAGIYSLSYSISQIMLLFNRALTQTITPWIYKKIKAERTDDIPRVAYTTMTFIAVVNLVLIAFAPEAVAVFAPESYYDAIWIIPPVAMSVFFVFLYSLFADFEFYFEKTGFMATASITGALTNVVLNFIFIKIFGYYAAGYTTLICYMMFAAGHFYFMNKICRENLNNTKVYSAKILLMISGIFLVFGFGLLFTYTNIYLRYGLIVTGAVMSFIKRDAIKGYIELLLTVRKKRAE